MQHILNNLLDLDKLLKPQVLQIFLLQFVFESLICILSSLIPFNQVIKVKILIKLDLDEAFESNAQYLTNLSMILRLSISKKYSLLVKF